MFGVIVLVIYMNVTTLMYS